MDDVVMLQEHSSWEEPPLWAESPAWDSAPAEIDPGIRIDSQLARAEFAAREIARATAGQLAAIHAMIHDARGFPEIFVGHGTAGPTGRGTQEHRDAGRESEATERERREFAERAAITELALGLGVSPNAVRNRLAEATALITRLPTVWAQFTEGEISYPNVRAILDAASCLPDTNQQDTERPEVDHPDAALVWAEFDRTLAGPATTVNSARMRILTRSLAEKLSTEPLSVRRNRAAADRRAWVEPAADGMAWLGSLQPADAAYRAYARINATAKHLAALSGETRTIDQLRADVLADLLTGEGTPYEVKTSVTVTVPVLTLLGDDGDDTTTPDRPNRFGHTTQARDAARLRLTPRSGRLNGYGPIDAKTARTLAAKAPSFYRILTHPVTGAILDVDRTSYKVPADLKRWILATHTYCVFPGCNRLAAECDIDHSVDWAHAGTTSAHNLAPLCRGNHRLKHCSRWTMIRRNDGRIQWKSPLGRIYDTDPPPF